MRGEVIQHLGELVRANKEALAALITREIGKPIAESRGEVQEVIDTCAFFQSEGRRLYGMTVPSELPDKQLFTFRTPVGPAAIITAGNFPVAVPSWYIVPALLCGNAVVWKPAEYTPAIAEAFAQLILHAGVPTGVFHMVLADGPSTFAGLERAIEDGSIRKVGFTGSTAVAQDRRAVRATPADPVSGARREEPARRDAPMPTSTWPSRAPCSAGSAPPDSGARRSAPRSCRPRCTTTSSIASRGQPRPP